MKMDSTVIDIESKFHELVQGYTARTSIIVLYVQLSVVG